MTSLPLITVITVVLNGKKHLEEAILSVINQTYENVEYIIIDGGSTDGTLEIINKYNEQIDYWVSEPDNGIYDAMNKAVALARGDWLYDDKLYPDSLEQIASHLRDKSVIYYGNVTMMSDGKKYDGYFNSYKLMYCNICHQSIFYPRSVFDYHRYETRYKTSSDFVLVQKCHGDKRFRFQHVPVDVARYNDMIGVSSTREDPQFLADKKKLIKANFSAFLYLLFLIRHYTARCLAILGVKDLLKAFLRRCKPCWGR
jgi:glycosyltransferase involved in cell wall biosynthesis